MLLSVPGGMSRLGLPATVTVPFFVSCLNCRWLPLVLTRYQPSFFSSLITSRTFMLEDTNGDDLQRNNRFVEQRALEMSERGSSLAYDFEVFIGAWRPH